MVEHTPNYQEVVGSNPAGCWAFFLLLLSFPTSLHHWSVLNQVPQRDAMCCERKKWRPEAQEAQITGLPLCQFFIVVRDDSLFHQKPALHTQWPILSLSLPVQQAFYFLNKHLGRKLVPKCIKKHLE